MTGISESTAHVVANMQCGIYCPGHCTHLMWYCAYCSSEGGWGAARERLEKIAADHKCPPAPGISGQAREEAERRHAEEMRSLSRAKYAEGSEYHRADGERDGFIAGAVWAASLTPEPSEDVRELMHLTLLEGRSINPNPEQDAQIEMMLRALHEDTIDAILSRFTVTPKPTNDSEGEKQ